MLTPTEVVTPIAFRIGRYSSSEGDDQLERQNADTLRQVVANGWEDGGFKGFADESGNEDTRRNQGKKDQRASLAWVSKQVALHAPHRPVRIVAWKWDRLFRDVSEKERIYRELASYPDVLIFSGEGVRNPKLANDRMMSTIETAFAQNYADTTREKIIVAHEARAAKLLPVTGWPGFGHRKDPGADSPWVADPATAPILIEAIGRILAGLPLGRLCDEWNEADVPSSLGGVWRVTSLRRVLTSPRLAGILVYSGKEIGPSPFIEALIDEPTFRSLCSMVTRRGKRGPRAARQLLTGVLRCGRCEATLNADADRGRRTYFCRGCGGLAIDAAGVEAEYVERLFAWIDSPKMRKGLAATGGRVDVIHGELADLDRELTKLKAHAARLPVDVYTAKYDAIAERSTALRAELDGISTANLSARWAGQGEALRGRWGNMDTEQQRDIILAVVGQTYVKPGGSGHRATPERIRARLERVA